MNVYSLIENINFSINKSNLHISVEDQVFYVENESRKTFNIPFIPVVTSLTRLYSKIRGDEIKLNITIYAFIDDELTDITAVISREALRNSSWSENLPLGGKGFLTIQQQIIIEAVIVSYLQHGNIIVDCQYLEHGLSPDNKIFIIGDSKVDLNNSYGDYSLLKEPLERIMQLLPNGKGALLLTTMLIATTSEVINKSEYSNCLFPHCVFTIIGQSGSLKTAISKALFCSEDGIANFISLSAKSTRYSVEKTLYENYSCVCVLDDICQENLRKKAYDNENIFEFIARTCGDEDAVRKTARSGNIKKLNVVALVTSENEPSSTASTILRTVPIYTARNECDLKHLSFIQENPSMLREIKISALSYFFSDSNSVQKLKNIFDETLAELKVKYRLIPHRVTYTHAQIITYYKFYMEYFGLCGVNGDLIKTQFEEITAYLFSLAQAQVKKIASETPISAVSSELIMTFEEADLPEFEIIDMKYYTNVKDFEKHPALKYGDMVILTYDQQKMLCRSLERTYEIKLKQPQLSSLLKKYCLQGLGIDNRIYINNKRLRALSLDIKKLKGEIDYEYVI